MGKTCAWTEIVVLLSCLEDILAYRRTRLPARLYLPLALLLCVASWWAMMPSGVVVALMDLLLVGSLLVQFRLWDDLADRMRDRQNHPERLLARTNRVGPFVGLLVVLSGSNLVWLVLSRPVTAFVVLLTLDAGFAAWYGGLRERWPGVVLQYHVLLSKYPVFVYLVGAARPAPWTTTRLCLLLVIYLGLCIREIHSDPGLRSARGWLRAEALALVVVGLVWLLEARLT